MSQSIIKRLIKVCEDDRAFKFYCLETATSLFGEPGLSKSSGKIGGRSIQVFWKCASRQDALNLLRDKIRQKKSKGYIEAYSDDWLVPASMLWEYQERQKQTYKSRELPSVGDGRQLDLFVRYASFEQPSPQQRDGNVVTMLSASTQVRSPKCDDIELCELDIEDDQYLELCESLYGSGVVSLGQLNSMSDPQIAAILDVSHVAVSELRRRVRHALAFEFGSNNVVSMFDFHQGRRAS